MRENKLIKILIPIVALVVVFESVILVSNLDKKSTVVDESSKVDEVTDERLVEEPVVDFVWQIDEGDIEIGKSYKVALNLLAREEMTLDSIESHIYFDPKLVEVSKLVTNKEAFDDDLKPLVDNKVGLISSVLWSGDDSGVGYEVKKGDDLSVLTFMVTPKSVGKIELELSTSKVDDRFATIVSETGTAKPLPYSSNNLEINVIK